MRLQPKWFVLILLAATPSIVVGQRSPSDVSTGTIGPPIPALEPYSSLGTVERVDQTPRSWSSRRALSLSATGAGDRTPDVLRVHLRVAPSAPPAAIGAGVGAVIGALVIIAAADGGLGCVADAECAWYVAGGAAAGGAVGLVVGAIVGAARRAPR